MILGAHVSISGGISNAPINGELATCDSIQFFSHNQRRWIVRELASEEIENFKSNVKKLCVYPAAIHASYLINLASSNDDIRQKSILSLVNDLDRAESLGVENVVFHPGAHLGQGEVAGIRKVARAINKILNLTSTRKPKLVIEITAGEGSVLCYNFEQIAMVLEQVDKSDRVAFCFDTCHAFAAGYDIRSPSGIEKVLTECDRLVGVDRIAVFHLNDSKCEIGSRMDRHEEIGKGMIGTEAFRYLVNCGKFARTPGILEFPGDTEGYRRNLQLLRRLIDGQNRRKCKETP